MNVLKSTPAGRPRPASRDSPVPSTNRKSTGCTSDVIARSRSVRNLISSRRQTMLTARRSARTLRSGTATLMSSVRSRCSASTASRLAVSCAAIATSLLPSAEPRRDPAVAVADRSLGVADGFAGVGHEHVVEGGPGHAHRLDRHRQAREQLGYEVLARLHRERHQSLVHGRLEPEHLSQRADRGLVVRGAYLHPVLADRGLERFWRVDRHDGPVVDDGDPVAVLRLVHVVRGQEDRDVLALFQVVDVVPDGHPGLRVESDRRLIEEQHPGRVQQAARDLQPALHAAGVGGDHAAPPVPQPDHLEHLTQPRRERRLGHAVEVRVEAQVLLPGQVAVQGGVLEHQADVAAHGVPFPHHVMTGDPGGTRGRVRQGAQDLDRGGLALPVRPEETEGLSDGYLEVDAAHGIDLAVPLGQLADRDSRSHPCVSSPASSPSAARIRYSARRVSARILLAWATWAAEPACATCVTATATCRMVSCSWTSAASTLPVTASQDALSSSACAWTYARPSSVSVYIRRRSSPASVWIKASSSSCCSAGYTDPALGRQTPSVRAPISWMI